MKKIAITVLAALALVSCSDEFLNKEPLAVGSNVTFYDNPINCELAVNAIYDPLQWESMYSRNFWGIADVATDDAEKGGGEDAPRYKDDQLEMFDISTYNVNQLNTYIKDMWVGYYIGIGRANAMLDQTTEFLTSEDSVIYKRLRGEARFLRAFFYFDMVRLWGPVPLVTATVSPGDSYSIGNRASGDDEKGTKQIEEIYNFVVDELTAIQNDLPWSYDAANFGRVTQAAVKTLLAKALLYRADVLKQNADYELAFQTAKNLINNPNNPHSLEPKYQDIFDMDNLKENSPEIIFSIQFIDGATSESYDRAGQSEGTIKPTYVGPRYYIKDDGSVATSGDYGYGFLMPRQDLVNQFDANDPRLDMMYKPNDSIYWDLPTKSTTKTPKWYKIYYPSYTTGYYCKKSGLNYDKFGTAKAQASGKDIPVIRYADLLLIAAEAGVQSGHADDAKTYINLIRKRARESKRVMTAYNTYTYSVGTVPADLPSVTLNDVKKERRMELYCEGHRYFDVVRWGEADVIFGAIKSDIAGNPVNWKPATLGRMPIPQEQIILHNSGNLKQNPGY